MSDQGPTLSERASKNALFTTIGHGAAALCLPALVGLWLSLSSMDREITAIRVELSAGLLPRIVNLERRADVIQAELTDRTLDRFTTADGAQLKVELLAEISEIKADLKALSKKVETLSR